jgi:hypothetical protein
MPTWLVQRGVPIVEGGSDVDGVNGTEPLYSSCLFLEAHGQFVDALRERYDGNPDVAFIDIGSYGTYGEWDSEQYDDEPESLDWHARRRIIDMYIGGKGTRPCAVLDDQISQVAYDYEGFRETQLVMPFTPWFEDSTIYALSRRQDIGLRHDALGSEKHQDYFREQISGLVEQRWPNAPIVFEFSSEGYTPEALRSAREFAQEMHASLVHDNFGGLGSDALIEELLAVVGYRLTLRQMTYTSDLGRGETMDFEMVWENTGVAPPYFGDNPLVISLTGTTGESVIEHQLEPHLRSWIPGQSITLTGEITLPDSLQTGRYDLRLAFVNRANGKSILNIAINGRDEQGWYRIGPVNIVRQ